MKDANELPLEVLREACLTAIEVAAAFDRAASANGGTVLSQLFGGELSHEDVILLAEAKLQFAGKTDKQGIDADVAKWAKDGADALPEVALLVERYRALLPP